MSSVPVELAPLTQSVSSSERRAFIDRHATRQSASTGMGTGFAVTAFTLLLIAGVVAALFLSDGRPVPVSLMVATGVLIGLVGVVQLLRWLPRRPRWARRVRIARFAQANGMSYTDSIPDPAEPGMIFRLGHRRLATSVVRMAQPRRVEFGNMSYRVDSDRDHAPAGARSADWGYVAFRLDAPLPHIVLERRGAGIGSGLPFTPASDQRLRLEGDFDRMFALHCPSSYETDALYLFTPDIMALLMDRAGDFDIEIVDDRLYLYTRDPVSTDSPERWTRMLQIVAAISTKLDQWARWRDLPADEADAPDAHVERPALVRPAGRRLRRAFPWAAAILSILWVAFWLIVA